MTFLRLRAFFVDSQNHLKYFLRELPQRLQNHIFKMVQKIYVTYNQVSMRDISYHILHLKAAAASVTRLPLPLAPAPQKIVLGAFLYPFCSFCFPSRARATGMEFHALHWDFCCIIARNIGCDTRSHICTAPDLLFPFIHRNFPDKPLEITN